MPDNGLPPAPSPLQISAVVCTYNRAALLERALASLRRQTLHPEKYEIIVVDNASRDNTAAIAARFAAEPGAPLRYCYEPELGISHARNRGVREASSALIAFMDDDAEAGEEWLEALVLAFQGQPARPISAGGKVLPVWDVPRPAWLPAAAQRILSYRDHGDKARVLDYPREGLVGCNIAFERAFLLERGRFEPRLGRRGSQLLGNEEVALMRSIAAQGGVVLYEPRAIVRHLVHRERLTLRWLLRRSYDQGQSDRMLAHLYGAVSSRDSAGSVAPRATRSHPLSRLLSGLASRQTDTAVLALMDIAWRLGNISQSLKLRLRRAGEGPAANLKHASGKDLAHAD